MEHELERSIKERNTYMAEYRVGLNSGAVRWIRSTGRVLFDDRNVPQKMAGISIDITEQKLFTEELTKQVRERTLELQRSNDDLLQFAHVASHDLKEPVRKIQTFNNRIIDEYAENMPQKAKSYLQKIAGATERIYSMIDGVLNYSKLSNSTQSFGPVDLNNVMQMIESDLEMMISERHAVITTNDLPTIRASSILIYQLFYNLIANALKFARAGEPARITVSSKFVLVDGREFAEIRLADNGIGFEAEFSEIIFKTFTRLNPVDDYEGTGLGLSLCQKIVERHEGTITAEGEPEQGAVFTIRLPRL